MCHESIHSLAVRDATPCDIWSTAFHTSDVMPVVTDGIVTFSVVLARYDKDSSEGPRKHHGAVCQSSARSPRSSELRLLLCWAPLVTKFEVSRCASLRLKIGNDSESMTFQRGTEISAWH